MTSETPYQFEFCGWRIRICESFGTLDSGREADLVVINEDERTAHLVLDQAWVSSALGSHLPSTILAGWARLMKIFVKLFEERIAGR